MKKSFFILMAVWLISITTTAAEPSQIIEQANQAYMQEEYAYAIELYEQVLALGLESAALYYNLGNSYFKANRLAPAILNYERALRMKPFDENIQHNLEIARSKTIDQIEPVPVIFYEKWWKAFLFLLSIDRWAVMALITLFLAFMMLLLYFFSGSIGLKKTGLIVSLLLLLVSATSFLAAQRQYAYNYKKHYAIVFEPRVTVKSGPSQTSTDLFVLHEGTKVRIIDNISEWVEIRIANGNSGWLKRTSVIPVNASDADSP